METGLYNVPNGFTHTSNPNASSCLPILSEKQLPNIIILSENVMFMWHLSSMTGVWSLIMLQKYQKIRQKCYL